MKTRGKIRTGCLHCGCRLAAGFLAAALWSASAADGPAPAALKPPSFGLLGRRNIFDQTRVRGRVTDPGSARPGSAPRAEYLVLTGTIDYGGRAYAFFGSSDPAFHRVVKVRDGIGSHTVAGISTTNVVLESQDGRLVVPVGHRISRLEDGGWQITNPVQAVAGGWAEAGVGQTGAPPAGVVGPGETSELMKRMMERRRKELSP